MAGLAGDHADGGTAMKKLKEIFCEVIRIAAESFLRKWIVAVR